MCCALPISKLGHNLLTVQLFHKCLTVTYRSPIGITSGIINLFLYNAKIFTKPQSLRHVQLCFDCFQGSTGKHCQTPKRSNNEPHHTTCLYLNQRCSNHQESRFQFFPTQNSAKNKNAHALVVLCLKAEPSGANQTKQLTCSERSRQSATV